MNIQKLKYKFHSGKNSKPWYYIKEYARLYTPACILIWRGQHLLDKAKKRKDYDYILNRVNYYNKLTEDNILLNKDLWDKEAVKVAEQPMTRQKVYYLDTLEYAHCFDGNNKWNLLPGDITYVEDIPTIVKSRPIHGENQNSVLLKMDKVRHFIFVKDKLSFAEKKTRLSSEGK